MKEKLLKMWGYVLSVVLHDVTWEFGHIAKKIIFAANVVSGQSIGGLGSHVMWCDVKDLASLVEISGREVRWKYLGGRSTHCWSGRFGTRSAEKGFTSYLCSHCTGALSLYKAAWAQIFGKWSCDIGSIAKEGFTSYLRRHCTGAALSAWAQIFGKLGPALDGIVIPIQNTLCKNCAALSAWAQIFGKWLL